MRATVWGVLLAALVGLSSAAGHAQRPSGTDALPPWHVPDVSTLADDDFGIAVRLGRQLIQHTSAMIGPDSDDASLRFAGNGLECQSCHLDAGTARFGLPFVGIWDAYPGFSARAGADQTLADRINGCMQRSMNGRILPPDSRELHAMEAYIRFLGSNDPSRTPPIGRGAPKLPLPGKAADPARGRAVYAAMCAACHRSDGQGVRYSSAEAHEKRQRYLFPPVWGPDSFNDGAGMARVMTAAWFVHANMPRGVTFDYPALHPDQAYDVAAYIDSQPRPHKADLSLDYPDRWLKPADAAYPPWSGPFSGREHKFGPWKPIEAWLRARVPSSENHERAAGDLEAAASPKTNQGR
jgi:thiosulfate dehydrogenase